MDRPTDWSDRRHASPVLTAGVGVAGANLTDPQVWSNEWMTTPVTVNPADRDAVVALLAAYSDAIDAGDFAGVADVLAAAHHTPLP